MCGVAKGNPISETKQFGLFLQSSLPFSRLLEFILILDLCCFMELLKQIYEETLISGSKGKINHMQIRDKYQQQMFKVYQRNAYHFAFSFGSVVFTAVILRAILDHPFFQFYFCNCSQLANEEHH